MRRRDADAGDGRRSEWEAYADYQSVSERVAESIGDAVEAIETIESSMLCGEKLSTERETVLRADVMAATIWLRTELENGRQQNELYDEILTRWDGDGEEEGLIEKFRDLDIMASRPGPWLNQFATDIHRAGWELGYLKAGREEKQTSSGDPYDGQVRDMFDSGSE